MAVNQLAGAGTLPGTTWSYVGLWVRALPLLTLDSNQEHPAPEADVLPLN